MTILRNMSRHKAWLIWALCLCTLFACVDPFQDDASLFRGRSLRLVRTSSQSQARSAEWQPVSTYLHDLGVEDIHHPTEFPLAIVLCILLLAYGASRRQRFVPSDTPPLPSAPVVRRSAGRAPPAIPSLAL